MTPVRVGRMLSFLNRLPDQAAGIGFYRRVWYSTHAHPPHVTEFTSALQHPLVVSENLSKELALGRMCGPFPFPPLADLVVSPLGLVPKKEPVKLYLIHHLSFPKGGSANDAIDLDACSI